MKLLGSLSFFCGFSFVVSFFFIYFADVHFSFHFADMKLFPTPSGKFAARRALCVLTLLAMLTPQLPLQAQRADFSKMSSVVRRAAMEQQTMQRSRQRSAAPRLTADGEAQLCAFVRVQGDCDEVLSAHGCRLLARLGQVAIASIPLGRLAPLSADLRVQRIEAGERCSMHMDITPGHVNALPVYRGEQLPQAFTGKGVVVGVQDVGFDLTHPTFYHRTDHHYRIGRLWDQLSADTVGSQLYVGAEYVNPWDVRRYAHSRDGLMLSHGTHTAGIAAGSGYDSPYRGMAFESDICLVNNAVTEDTVFIAQADRYKYTSATDALGFKYILDYAQMRGMPCVVSFSEGSHQDFYGDDVLLYEALASLTGPGRIIVASAGNDGAYGNHLQKPAGQESAGVFLYNVGTKGYLSMKGDAPFTFRFTYYHPKGRQVVEIPSATVMQQPDSLYTDTLVIDNEQYPVAIAGYPNIYDDREQAYEVLLGVPKANFGTASMRVSIEAVGREATVDFYRVGGAFLTDPSNPSLGGYDSAYSIHSPASAPSVVCVGATSYRVSYLNYRGEERVLDHGTGGVRADYSSLGPTLDGRTKPDVMAPGTNVVSAYSSYFLENNPDAYDLNQDVARFSFQGRTYAWNSNLGTSMSTPVVSGAIALWLQANPRLTPEDVMAVFSRTCRRYDPSLTYPNNAYGYGEIDVYAGLLDVLGVADNIPSLATRQPAAARFVLNADHRLQVLFNEPLRQSATLVLWTTDGRRLLTATCPPGALQLSEDLSSLPAGVYACQLKCADASVEGSTLIRR